MTQADKKKFILSVLTQQWWKAAYDENFTEDLVLEFPFAPPGMFQKVEFPQTLAHKEWLGRTVRSWDVEVISIVGLKQLDSDVFFLTYNVKGDVHWGGNDGAYQNRVIDRVTLRDGKICNIREWSNPFQYIWAAGREIPTFHVSLDHHANIGPALHQPLPPTPEYDLSPEACEARRAENIDRFGSDRPGYACTPIKVPEGFLRYVWFVPPEMKDYYSAEEEPFMSLWSNLSTESFRFLPGAIVYETEDPNEAFFEASAYGMYHWEGNHSYGGYMNRYLMHITMNEQGLCNRYDEYLNPINKMNSINQSIPSFPWLY